MPIRRTVSCPDFAQAYPHRPKSKFQADGDIVPKNTWWKDIVFPLWDGCVVGAGFCTIDNLIGSPLFYNRFSVWSWPNDNFSCGRMGKITQYIIFKNICINAPLEAEIVYRLLLQRSIQWITSQVFGNKKLKIQKYSIRVASLVSAVASGICFGLCYYKMRNTVDSVKAVSFGILLGLMNERYGLLAPITAHCVNNGLYFAFGPVSFIWKEA